LIPQRAVGYGTAPSARRNKNLRHGQAESAGRAEVDHPLELIRLLRNPLIYHSQITTSPHRSAYLITLSALASTFGGIVRPICLAVLD
jgi:hypothetical protein